MWQRAAPCGKATLAGLVVAVAVLAAGCASGSRRPSEPSASAPVPARGSASAEPTASGARFEVPGTAQGCPAHGLAVASASQLTGALASARPGETITLAPGTYQGDFTASRSGTRSAPITLCGSRRAVLAGPDIRHGYVLYLDGASWWRLDGFTVRGGQKGIVTDHASHDLLYGLYVAGSGRRGRAPAVVQLR